MGVKAFCAGLAALVVGGFAGPSLAAAAPLYPDLRMLAPTELHPLTAEVNGEVHHRLHFETRILNAGEGPLEIDRIPTASGIADVVQRIYEQPAGFRDERIGASVFGTDDFTFSVENIAAYEVWTQRAFARAQARGFTRGAPLFVRDGVSHCLGDSEQIDEGATGVAQYSCTKIRMGISVGWANLEGWFEDVQSVDFGTTPLPDGDYVLRAIADPDNVLFESGGKSDPAREGTVANAGVTYFRFVNGQLAGVE